VKLFSFLPKATGQGTEPVIVAAQLQNHCELLTQAPAALKEVLPACWSQADTMQGGMISCSSNAEP